MFRPIIIAHRGDSSRAVENSLEAIRLAMSVPSDMIEIDIRRSRDNHLYLMHDKKTGRTADKDIDIEVSGSDEISMLRLKNGEAVPSLQDALAVIDGRVGLNIEIKSDGAGGLAAAVVKGAGYTGQVLFSSFKESEITEVRRIMPNAPTALIFEKFSLSNIDAYRAKGYGIISIKKKIATEALVRTCHDRRIKVYVWTVDDIEEARVLMRWGVDGIYTNRPMLLKPIVERI